MKKLFAPILLAGLLLNITPAHAGWFSASQTQSGWMQSATNWAMNHPITMLASLSVLGLSAYGLWDYLSHNKKQDYVALHVIPMAFDGTKDTTFLLLGIEKNTKDNGQGWTPLHNLSVPKNANLEQEAFNIVRTQTQNLIRPTGQAITKIEEPNQVYIIIPVEFINTASLSGNSYKACFEWIPLESFTDPEKKPIRRSDNGPRVPPALHEMLHKHFNPAQQPQLTQQLSPKANGATHAPHGAQRQQSGANIASTSGHAVLAPQPQPVASLSTHVAAAPQQSGANVASSSKAPADQQSHNAPAWTQYATRIPGAIYFYDKNKPKNSDPAYYAFTNFYQAKVTFNNNIWHTSEHAYQAQKFTQRPDIQTLIQQEPLASKVFTVAQKHGDSVDKDWKKRSLQTMVDVVRAKFKQNKNLAQQLLNTGTAILVEASPFDGFYGYSTDPDKKGKPQFGLNHLGRILMHVRYELRYNTQLDYNEINPYPAYYAQ